MPGARSPRREALQRADGATSGGSLVPGLSCVFLRLVLRLGERMISRQGNSCQELVLQRDAGHDQDLFDAPRRTGDFLRRHLFPLRPEASLPRALRSSPCGFYYLGDH